MTTLFLMCALALSTTSTSVEKANAMTKITQVINDFSMAVDKRDVKATDAVLHSEFRAVVNQFMGADGVTVLPRAMYLNMLEQKKIGGDERTVKIHSIAITNNVAVARVTFTGKQLHFHTFIQLAENKQKEWHIVSDMPNVEAKQ